MQRVRELWREDRGRLAHYVVSAALAVVTLVETARNEAASPSLVAAALVAAVALLFTRDAPFVAPAVVSAAIVVIVGIGADEMRDSGAPFLVAVLFVPWCFAVYNERRKAIAGLVVAEGVGIWANSRFSETTEDYFWVAALISVSWTTGFVLNQRSARARELAERARELEGEQRAAAARAVTEERQRIARELHDVIAHSVSVMTVQAGAVRRLLRPEQRREREALETVEATGREALTEMRRLVGLLREQGAMPEFAPQPGLATIDSLLENVRAAGLPVDLEVDGAPRELAPGVDLAAYRVVQEALTNALKYAGPAHAWVVLHWRDEELELEIANDGRGDGDGNGGGHGLAGLRERVSLYGGQIRERPSRRGRLCRPRPAADRGGLIVTTVLIVDDQSLVRAGFRMILDAEPDIEVVGEAADGAEAVRTARELRPDVVLMDVRMPNVDGLEATRLVLEQAGEGGPEILTLTTFDLDEYVCEALRVGASGFLLKDTPPEQLVGAIHTWRAATRCWRRRSCGVSSRSSCTGRLCRCELPRLTRRAHGAGARECWATSPEVCPTRRSRRRHTSRRRR